MEILFLEPHHRVAWHGCTPLPALGARLVVDEHEFRVDGYVYLPAKPGAGAHLCIVVENPEDGRPMWLPGFSWDDLVCRATERSPGTSWTD